MRAAGVSPGRGCAEPTCALRSGDARARRGAGRMTGSLRRKAPPPSACSPSRRGPRWRVRRSSRPAPPEPWPADAEQLAGAVREGLAILLSAGVGQRAEVAEDHRAHDPHTDAPETPMVRGPPARRFRAVDQDPRRIRLPLSAAPLCEPLVSLARFAAPHSPRLYPAGVSFKPKPRRMLSRFAFPRSAVKEFKRPSKVVEDAGHFKS